MPIGALDPTKMSHYDLLTTRKMLDPKDPIQELLAPYEHRAFAREYVQDHPWTGVPAMMTFIPGYQIYKALGLKPEATPPSLEQAGQGYKGMWEGLFNR